MCLEAKIKTLKRIMVFIHGLASTTLYKGGLSMGEGSALKRGVILS